jgi:AcrR family transcriptional regulator
MANRPRPRKKPAVSKGQKTKQHLLATALTSFKKHGFEQTTLRQIAVRAKVSLGLLYRYYPSKDALVIELYDELSREFVRRGTPLPEGSWSMRFLHVLRLSIAVLSPHRDALRVMVPGLMVPASHPLFIPGGQPSHARVEEKFVEAVRGASDAPPEPERQGRRLYLVHLMLVLGWLLDRSPEQQATALALDLAERWAPLVAPLLALPGASALLEPAGDALELAVLGRRIP